MAIQKSRHYYSLDGTAVLGPVTYDELVKLYQNRTIGPHCVICREGSTEWKSLDPADFIGVSPKPLPLFPPAFPPLPPSMRTKRKPNRETDSSLGSSRSLLLIGICLVVSVAGAVLTSYYIPNDLGQPEKVARFIGFLVGVSILPLIVCLFFRKSRRLQVFTIGVVLMTVTSSAGQILLAVVGRPLMAQLQEITAEMEKKKRHQSRGVPTSGDPKSPSNDQELQNQLPSGNGGTSRATRALLVVMQEMASKTKDYEVAYAACPDFDETSITDLQGIATRRAAMAKVRITQVALLDYLEHFDEKCRAALMKEGLNESNQTEEILDPRFRAHLDIQIKLWRHQIKVTDAYLAELDFLEKIWGHWKAKDKEVIFDQQADLDNYNKIVATLNTESQAVEELQKENDK